MYQQSQTKDIIVNQPDSLLQGIHKRPLQTFFFFFHPRFHQYENTKPVRAIARFSPRTIHLTLSGIQYLPAFFKDATPQLMYIHFKTYIHWKLLFFIIITLIPYVHIFDKHFDSVTYLKYKTPHTQNVFSSQKHCKNGTRNTEQKYQVNETMKQTQIT